MTTHECVVKKVEHDDAIDKIAVTVDFPHEDFQDHVFTMAPDAIGSRMAGYKLDSPEQAFDAIVREVAMHLCEQIEPEGDGQIHELGGLHASVVVTHQPRNGLATVLGNHKGAIADAHEARKGVRVFTGRKPKAKKE